MFDRLGCLGVAGVMALGNATSILPSEIVLGLTGWILLAAHDAPPAGIFIGGLYAPPWAAQPVRLQPTGWPGSVGAR